MKLNDYLKLIELLYSFIGALLMLGISILVLVGLRMLF